MTVAPPLPDLVPFAEFARIVHGGDDPAWEPYPWQVRLAERCADPCAGPPAWVVAPTGSGKTLAVDALVWALAAQANLSPRERSASTRVVWAIDRRILVDQVHDHAAGLAARLDNALGDESDPLNGIAHRLLSLAATGDDDVIADPSERAGRNLHPLVATRWRGGMRREHELLSPLQPQIITSTVAQVGSRLLFRGYGVGAGSRAIAAGLAAADTTICLDEAHLAVPFGETVRMIRERRDEEPEGARAPGLRLMTLTATPPAGYEVDDSVALDEADRARLGGRWTGAKTLSLREPDGKPEQALADAVVELIESGSMVVACVANRVITARKAHDRLRKLLGEEDVLLLMGPQRPADRRQQLERASPILFDGEQPTTPLVVVATQTLEVGVDADFDAMVTQSASASALVQRLGRLNRTGTRPGRCVVIRDEGFPLYEADEPAAWEWLAGRPGGPEEIDVSVRALSDAGDTPPDAARPRAATLTDGIVGQLVQSGWRGPGTWTDPDIEPLLSGIGGETSPDVQVVWRCDLREEEADATGDEYRRTLVGLARPVADESLTLGVSAARNLLAGRLDGPRGRANEKLVDDGDAETSGRPERLSNVVKTPPFVVVRGREILLGGDHRPDDDRSVSLPEIAPGDTIVVPTRWGGVDQFGLAPAATGPAEDVLLTPDVEPTGAHPVRLSWETFTARPGGPSSRRERVRMWNELAQTLHAIGQAGAGDDLGSHDVEALERLREGRPLPRWLGALLDALASPPEGKVWRLRRATPLPVDAVDASDEEETQGVAEEGGGPIKRDNATATDQGAAGSDAAPEEHDESHERDPAPDAWVLALVDRRDRETSRRTMPPTVVTHSTAVRERVAGYASALDLPVPGQQALELAALAHDLGKLDGRFQAFLSNMSDAALANGPIAKSTFGTGDPAVSRLAGQQAGLPTDVRHEALSAAILADAIDRGMVPSDLRDADADLALFLTGAHHGHGRLLWPVERGGRAGEPVRGDLLGIVGEASGRNSDGWLGGRWLELFTTVNARYGPWGLAYLEAVFAAADRTISREEG